VGAPVSALKDFQEKIVKRRGSFAILELVALVAAKKKATPRPVSVRRGRQALAAVAR